MSAQERIRSYVTGHVSVPLADESDFFELGLVDSLFALQLVSFLEQEFSMSIEPDDLDIANFCSIAALNAFVTAKCSEEKLTGWTSI
ncbi:MAG: acyl carrier protein [Sphingomonas sp.]